ncbi:MAG: outer membrane beta-barrel protein [Bacteroidota bacterium]
MFRDIGIVAYGEHSIFSYSVAVMNGSGANVPEGLNSKDIVGRVDLAQVDNLMVCISAHLGTYENGTFDRLSHQRWGIHAEYQQSPLLPRGEYFIRDREMVPDNRARSTGGYLLAKYEISEKWEAIGRYDHFSPEGEGNPYQGFTLGPNYQLGANTRLLLNGILYTPVNDDAMHNLLNIQLQMVL